MMVVWWWCGDGVVMVGVWCGVMVVWWWWCGGGVEC